MSLHVERTFDTESSIGDVIGKSSWELVSVINANVDDNKGKKLLGTSFHATPRMPLKMRTLAIMEEVEKAKHP